MTVFGPQDVFWGDSGSPGAAPSGFGGFGRSQGSQLGKPGKIIKIQVKFRTISQSLQTLHATVGFQLGNQTVYKNLRSLKRFFSAPVARGGGPRRWRWPAARFGSARRGAPRRDARIEAAARGIGSTKWPTKPSTKPSTKFITASETLLGSNILLIVTMCFLSVNFV